MHCMPTCVRQVVGGVLLRDGAQASLRHCVLRGARLVSALLVRLFLRPYPINKVEVRMPRGGFILAETLQNATVGRNPKYLKP